MSEALELRALYAALEANPADRLTKLALADWFDEHGQSPAAEVIRWLADQGKVPYRYFHESPDLCVRHTNWHDGWYWWATENADSWGYPRSCQMPHHLWVRLQHTFDYNPAVFREYETVRAAIEAVIRAWTRKRAWYRRKKKGR